jgi:hypothetical protein
MFASDAGRTLDEQGDGPVMNLYSCRLDGSSIRQLTFNPNDDIDPCLMTDGRVVLASRRYTGRRPGLSLFGINSDGTDYATYSGDQGRGTMRMPCQTAAGLVVFVESQGGWDDAGKLAAVETRRSLHSYRSLSNDEEVRYHSPVPLSDGSILVSRRPQGDEGTHGVYRFDPTSGEAMLIYDDPEFHDIHARVLVARPTPDGRSSVVDDKYRTGKLYCLNAYETIEPVGKLIKRGDIKRVRVYQGLPARMGAGLSLSDSRDAMQKRLQGLAPVESDGSFHIEVPADVPVQLQTLDEKGKVLQACSWIWVKPREARGCIGCHEDPELTPENRLVGALKKPAVRLVEPTADTQ